MNKKTCYSISSSLCKILHRIPTGYSVLKYLLTELAKETKTLKTVKLCNQIHTCASVMYPNIILPFGIFISTELSV